MKKQLLSQESKERLAELAIKTIGNAFVIIGKSLIESRAQQLNPTTNNDSLYRVSNLESEIHNDGLERLRRNCNTIDGIKTETNHINYSELKLNNKNEIR